MPGELDRHEVQKMIAEGAQLVDVLSDSEWEQSHIVGAVHIPLKQLDELAPTTLDKQRPVIAYCYDALCDLSPRAAWRLEMLGFADVYDYTASKMDWIGDGLPFEGTLLDQPRLSTLASTVVPTCEATETIADVRGRVGDWGMCLVVHGPQRVVVGLVRAEAFGLEDDRPIAAVMQQGPSTERPHVTASEMAEKLTKQPTPWVVVTTLSGHLIGVAFPSDIRAAAVDEHG